MDVFYYKCPACDSRIVEPNEDHTLMVCLTCGFAWGEATKRSHLSSFDIIAGGILAIFIVLACLCDVIAASFISKLGGA